MRYATPSRLNTFGGTLRAFVSVCETVRRRHRPIRPRSPPGAALGSTYDHSETGGQEEGAGQRDAPLDTLAQQSFCRKRQQARRMLHRTMVRLERGRSTHGGVLGAVSPLGPSWVSFHRSGERLGCYMCEQNTHADRVLPAARPGPAAQPRATDQGSERCCAQARSTREAKSCELPTNNVSPSQNCHSAIYESFSHPSRKCCGLARGVKPAICLEGRGEAGGRSLCSCA